MGGAGDEKKSKPLLAVGFDAWLVMTGGDLGATSKKLPPGAIVGGACLVVAGDFAPNELVRSANGDGFAAG
jgi:hypothetical protein